MTRGAMAGFGGGFLMTFGISKMLGASTSSSLFSGLAVGLALGGTFEFVIAPNVRAKIEKAQYQAIKDMNQAQADSLAQRIYAAERGRSVNASDMFDKQKMIDALALANYTYKEGKAIKN